MTQAEISAGPPIPPAARFHLMDDKTFEILVQTWMARIAPRYLGIERFGGPGDMGRDVMGWTTDKKCLGPWDNVQCKHLNRSLAPSDPWPELGKILWHAHTRAVPALWAVRSRARIETPLSEREVE